MGRKIHERLGYQKPRVPPAKKSGRRFYRNPARGRLQTQTLKSLFLVVSNLHTDLFLSPILSASNAFCSSFSSLRFSSLFSTIASKATDFCIAALEEAIEKYGTPERTGIKIDYYLGFKTWLQWKKDVVSMVEKIAKKYSKKAFRIVDFSVYIHLRLKKCLLTLK